jgi:DNA-binding response OmpR family regulator
MVVDDDPDITLTFATVLQEHGYKVDSFNNPVLALSRFSPHTYDLVLIDIRMPEMTGFELYREIRRKDSRVKICFMTAFETHYEEFKNAFPTLISSYIIKKPISMDDLLLEVSSKLE